MQKLDERNLGSVLRLRHRVLHRVSVSELPFVLACLAETIHIYRARLSGQLIVVPSAGDTICGEWAPGALRVPAKEKNP